MTIDTPTVDPKVKAGGRSVGFSAPIGILFMWILTSTGLNVPPEVAVAIGSLITGGLTFLVSYYK